MQSRPDRARARLLAAALLLVWPVVARGQSDGCALVADDRIAGQQVLRCGEGLIVRAAPGASYRPVDLSGQGPPVALQVDRGAVEVEFHPRNGQRSFQILTPDAIAAVRGTTWIVDVTPMRTSTFVIAGTVAVRRAQSAAQVYLDAGQGVDVAAGTTPLVVKRWPATRVRALLARFGE